MSTYELTRYPAPGGCRGYVMTEREKDEICEAVLALCQAIKKAHVGFPGVTAPPPLDPVNPSPVYRDLERLSGA